MSDEFVDLQIVLRHYWRQYRSQIMAIVVVLLLLWALGSTFYTVDAHSEGVVLRLGKLSTTTLSGLHFKLPWPIDTVYKVPVARVQSLEFGRRPTKEDKTMARMLTGDLNLAHVEWVVQYRIKEPKGYLFKIGGERRADPATNATDLIRDVSEAVMRQIIGDVSVDLVITVGREKIANDAKEEIQRMLDGFEAGIRVVAVELLPVTPPDPVKDAFDAVNRAKQSKETVVNEAKGERNRLIPAARGRRDRTIVEAEGYAVRVKKEAQGRATAFLARLAEYEKAPEVTEMRLYLEAMEEVLAQVDDKIIIDQSVKGVLPLLDLGGGRGENPRGLKPAARGQKGGGR